MWDVDVSAILAHRAANKGAFAREGVNLTLTAYFVEAIVAGLRAVPAANATWSEEGVIIKRYYNIGMATALPMDANGLGYVGGEDYGFICLAKRGSVSAEQRAAVESWLKGRSELKGFTLSPLLDVWYPENTVNA